MYDDIIQKIKSLYGDDFTPLHAPVFFGNEKKYLNECIDSTFVSSVGKFVNLFEEKICEYTNSSFAIATMNGTAALHMALLLAGVSRKDEILTQSFTFVATANAISYTGAKPLFIDIEQDSLGLCPNSLARFLSENTKMKNGFCVNNNTGKTIRACVPMHSFGHIGKIEEIIAICKDYNIEVIEDAAEALGSSKNSQHAGTFSNIGILSFNGNKIATTGGGGMILLKDKKLAARAKHLTTTAKIPHEWEFKHDELGYNYRLPNINAALGVAQLENLDIILKRKREIAKEYSEFFKKYDVKFLAEPVNCQSNYWLNAILLNSLIERNEFLDRSNSEGVMTRPAWDLIHTLPNFKSCEVFEDLANSFFVQERLVNIPSGVINE